MRFAEFHEQEYEGFLYSHLERTDRRLWHPHEVLEHYLGFDRGLFLTHYYLWRMKGHRRPLRGFAPFYFYDLWPELGSAGISRNRLPRFRLNCFIQAKRPEYTRRAPRAAAGLGRRRPVYRVGVENEQQRVLERIADRMSDRAMVVYAAPVFFRSGELFHHGARGTVPENSTFPDVLAMAEHRYWYYNEPGADGIRNPDEEPVSFPTLAARIERFAAEVGLPESPSAELLALSAALREVLLAGEVEFTPREAYLTEEWRAVDAYCDINEAPATVRGFLVVDAFTRAFRLGWFAITEGAV